MACRPPDVEYRTVQVPVPVPCPQLPYVPWPDLPINKLNALSTPDEIAKAYVLTVEILKHSLQNAILVIGTHNAAR